MWNKTWSCPIANGLQIGFDDSICQVVFFSFYSQISLIPLFHANVYELKNQYLCKFPLGTGLCPQTRVSCCVSVEQLKEFCSVVSRSYLHQDWTEEFRVSDCTLPNAGVFGRNNPKGDLLLAASHSQNNMYECFYCYILSTVSLNADWPGVQTFTSWWVHDLLLFVFKSHENFRSLSISNWNLIFLTIWVAIKVKDPLHTCFKIF